jgi:hypothetical protein
MHFQIPFKHKLSTLLRTLFRSFFKTQSTGASGLKITTHRWGWPTIHNRAVSCSAFT